jgi:hypothetical protein
MFKINLFSVVVVCTIIVSAQAMDNATELPSTVKLPSAEKLRSYLFKGGFKDFVNAKNIDTFLGGQELNPLKLFKIVADYVEHYHQYLRDEAQAQEKHVGFRVTVPVAFTREEVLKWILHESPAVYSKLLDFEERLNNSLNQAKL